MQCHIIHPIIPVEAHQALVLRHAVQLLLGVALVQDVDHALQLHHLGLQTNKKNRALIRCTTFGLTSVRGTSQKHNLFDP